MNYLKYAMMMFAALALGLALHLHLASYGAHGAVVLAACALPIALGAITVWTRRGLPRWAAILSAVSFLVAAMKTSHRPFQNVMMAAVGGLLLAIVLAIKLERRA